MNNNLISNYLYKHGLQEFVPLLIETILRNGSCLKSLGTFVIAKLLSSVSEFEEKVFWAAWV